KTILAKPVKTVKTQLGQFQVMDFSEIRQSGSYILQAGDAATGPFQIDTNVWRETILKALNFLYAERCGMAIPGVHGICHRDWTAVHGDQRIVINGGWHDAGDLTQGLGNTGEIVYGLFSLAEHLHAMDQDPELYQRLLQEARWGLDWVLKTSFGDGFRNQGSISSRWSHRRARFKGVGRAPGGVFAKAGAGRLAFCLRRDVGNQCHEFERALA